MIIYSVLAILIRVFLAFQLYLTGQKALKPHTRTPETIFTLIAALALLVGFYVYLVTLVLVIYFGVKLWERKQQGKKIGFALIILILTFILFAKGPGQFALTSY